MTKIQCDCGERTYTIRYKDGKRVCDKCESRNLSGQFLRRLELEAKYYEKDILQPINKDGTINKNYEEVYGKYEPKKSKRRDKETETDE